MKLFGGFEISDDIRGKITDEHMKMIADVLDELGFRYKYILPSSKKDGSLADFESVTVAYKTSRLFFDDNGKKFLIPNYKRTDTKPRTICATLYIHYNYARDNEAEEFRPHCTINIKLHGACWPYGRKEDIVVNRPAGFEDVYNYGFIPEHIETIRNSFATLKRYMDAGEEFPKK